MYRVAMVAALFAPLLMEAQNTGTITGRVLDASTNQPIPKVHVGSTSGGPSGSFVGVLTGADGSYTLENVRAGAIQMTVNLENYRFIMVPEEPRSTFPLRAGETLHRDFLMHRQARIYGKLVDRDTGKGITGHLVSAVRKGYFPGFTFFVSRAGEQKGDEFEITNLDPGDYLIQIDSTEEALFVFPADKSPKPAPKICYGQSWFPDVASIDLAVPIHLGEGESRKVEISLHGRETHSLSGVLVAPHDLEGQPLTFALQTSVLSGWVATMPAPGTFRVDNLTPGYYRVSLVGGKPPNNSRNYRDYMLATLDAGNDRTPTVNGVGDYFFEISDHDVDNFKIALLPYAGVSGEVRMLEKDVPLPARLGVALYPTAELTNPKTGGAIGGGPSEVRGTPVRDGRFRQEWLHPSEYWPQLIGLPKGYAVAQVLFEGSRPNNNTITLHGPDTPLTFVLTSRPGAITGVVRDSNQNPVRGAVVVLLPNILPDKVERESILALESGEDGGFVFRDLAPGKYRAFVLTEADSARQGDVEYLRRRANEVEATEVTAGQSVRIELKR